jgi:hypothetical protein
MRTTYIINHVDVGPSFNEESSDLEVPPVCCEMQGGESVLQSTCITEGKMILDDATYRVSTPLSTYSASDRVDKDAKVFFYELHGNRKLNRPASIEN